MPVAEGVLLHVEGLEKTVRRNRRSDQLRNRYPPRGARRLDRTQRAGKTTVFNLLSGVLKPTKGRIIFNGRDITGARPDQNSVAGIARTFQNIRLFNELSVSDNIKTAFHMHIGSGFWQTLLHTSGFRRAEQEMDKRADEFIDLLDLAALRHEPVKNLPYGIQRRVEIARALAALPKLLLLDEPAAGLNLNETNELIQSITRIHRDFGLTIFLVEHDMKFVMTTCRKIQVLDRGSILKMGSPETIRHDPAVIEAYLGKPKGAGYAQGG
jgi:branched-chain amino acid transport system ATP-binding protein